MSGPRPEVRAVLWDADGVLQRGGDDWQAGYAALPGVDDDFLEATWRAELPLMSGGDFPAALAEVARVHGVDAPVELLLSRWRSIEPLTGSWELVRGVRDAGVRCYLATNQQAYRGAHMQATLGYGDRLDGAFYSYELGVAKPDPEYFRVILERLSLPGGSVLFLDDRDDNVAGAREAGLRAERWEHGDGVAALEQHLSRHGVPVGPQPSGGGSGVC